MPSSKKTELFAEPKLCKRCGSCEAVCPSEVFAWEGDKLAVFHPGWCIRCGHCVAACPTGALNHSEFDKSDFMRVESKTPVSAKELEKLFWARRSCRRFKDEPVSGEEVDRLLDMARNSPTATNAQNVRYLVLNDPESIERLKKETAKHYLRLARAMKNPFVRLALGFKEGAKTVSAYRYHILAIAERFKKVLQGQDKLFYGAPTVIVICASGMPHLASASCNLAAMQILLAAETMELGACYNGYALTALVRDKRAVRSIGVPEGYKPWAVIAIGKPGGEFYQAPLRRKPRIVG